MSWKRLPTSSAIAFVAAVGACYGAFRACAREAFTSTSPDGKFKVVVYRLPNFSMTPGSGSDGPAYADVYKANGEKLGHVEIEMLLCADVCWYDDHVDVGQTWIRLN